MSKDTAPTTGLTAYFQGEANSKRNEKSDRSARARRKKAKTPGSREWKLGGKQPAWTLGARTDKEAASDRAAGEARRVSVPYLSTRGFGFTFDDDQDVWVDKTGKTHSPEAINRLAERTRVSRKMAPAHELTPERMKSLTEGFFAWVNEHYLVSPEWMLEQGHDGTVTHRADGGDQHNLPDEMVNEIDVNPVVKIVGGAMAVTVAVMGIYASLGTATTFADKMLLAVEQGNRAIGAVNGARNVAEGLGWLSVDVAAGSWKPKQFQRLREHIREHAGRMVDRFCGEVWPSTEDDARKLLTAYVRRDV